MHVLHSLIHTSSSPPCAHAIVPSADRNCHAQFVQGILVPLFRQDRRVSQNCFLSKPDREPEEVDPGGERRTSQATRTMWRRRALECVCAMQKGAWKDLGDVNERMRGFAKKAAPAKASKGTKKGKHDTSKKQPKRKLDETVGKELQFVLDAFLPQPKEKHNMDEETLKQKAAEAKAYSRKKVGQQEHVDPSFDRETDLAFWTPRIANERRRLSCAHERCVGTVRHGHGADAGT